jgi:hypothetical protein
MGTVVFKGQTTDIESKVYVVADNEPLQVQISGVLDGADVRTLVLDEVGNAGVIKPLSWRASESDSLPAPPLGDGGLDIINSSRIKFDIINAGALTDINLSFTAKGVS